MDVPKKERSLALRITERSNLEEDEMAMITKDFKKYLMRGKGSSRGGNYNKARVPEKQTNEGCYKCGKTDHHIKNCPQWEIEWKKERSERKNRKKEQVHPKKNKGLTKAMVSTWGEISDEESDDEDGDEQVLMEIGESYEESEVSIIHLKDKIKFLSKKKLSELLLDFIDESEVINKEKEQLSKDCVILKAKCKNLELRVSETVSENTALKNQVHTFEANVLELKSENLKLKLGTSKKTVDCTQLTLEENIGKLKDELYRKDEQVRVLKEDLGKVKHELDRTSKRNRSSDALSWLQEYYSSNRRGLGFGNQLPKWYPKSKYLTLPENKICTHCGKTGHYKSECNAKERVQVKGSSQIWYMDSGCSKHVTRSKDQFLLLEDLKGGNVSFGNGKKGEIIGVGKVGKDDSHSIENVYLIDGLKYSLISVSQLCDTDEVFDMFTFFVRKTQEQLGNQLVSIRCMTKPLIEKTLYELLKGRKSNISHLRAFGCKCIVHNNNKDSLGKFDPRSDEGVFLGYFLHSKAYKVYSKKTKCVEESVHVVFDETNILSERQEHDDEAIELIKHLNETTAQTEASLEEGTGDGTGSSIPGNMTGGIEQNNSQTSVEPDTDWVNSMQDELNQFEKSQVWHLVPRPLDRSAIGTKWVFRNKLDEDGTFTRNTTRFVVQEYSQEKGIDYDETFAPVARGMIGSLLYLTTSRPDIVFSVGLCARFQANLKESHLTAVKRILRYLKGTTDLCLWYPKGSNFNLVGYADTDYTYTKVFSMKNLIHQDNTSLEELVVKIKKKKEKESKGVRSAVRGKGKRVVDSSPTPVSLTKDTGAMVV
ncbi:uncharacterized protein [Nicotiana tomentosiformis]|uniref:uncharacterized protein n=1 Tax=Nicotiana tomentosiformis TaxID=4098 RepID=UPI00388CE3CE